MQYDTKIRHVTIPGLRLHLRRGDPDMLWVNGQDLLLLNRTAAEFVEAFIIVMSRHPAGLDTGEFKREVAERMKRHYPDIPEEVLIRDFDAIFGSLLEVSKGSCPIKELGLETQATDPKLWTAPPRIDLALTYRCNNNCYFCYTGGPRKVKELSTADWKKIIANLWDSGVPQIVFTGGEPTLRDDLVELIENSKEFVTGVVTNGRKMASLAAALNKAELDYVQISLESHLPELHDKMVGMPGAWQETRDGVTAALNNNLSVVTNTTLTQDNLVLFPDLIKYGATLGLKMMACNTLICSGRGTCSKKDAGIPMDELKSVLTKAADTAREAGIKLDWYTPTCYKQFNPVELGFGVKACSAAQYNMTIEPDGEVIPCQSWFKDRLGNILKKKWTKIWNHPVAVGFRNKAYLKNRKECAGCEFLTQCYGGCPLEY